jgi:hypothetical protein
LVHFSTCVAVEGFDGAAAAGLVAGRDEGACAMAALELKIVAIRTAFKQN